MRKIIILSLMCIGMILITGCTGSSSKTVPPATTGHPVASVKMTSVNGVITSYVTNNMDFAEEFTLVIDCYDGNIKIDTLMVDVPPLAAGETGRAKGYAPAGTDSIRLSSVAASVGGDLYKVTYELL
jgi:hypothetical protein